MFSLVNKLFSHSLIAAIFLENCRVYRDVRHKVSHLKCMDIKFKKKQNHKSKQISQNQKKKENVQILKLTCLDLFFAEKGLVQTDG